MRGPELRFELTRRFPRHLRIFLAFERKPRLAGNRSPTCRTEGIVSKIAKRERPGSPLARGAPIRAIPARRGVGGTSRSA